jgi:hypothetical protein
MSEWRQTFGILYDKKILNKLKDKFYGTVIRPVMMYDVECRATKGQHVQNMSIAERQMLCWICDHTRRDQIKNDDKGTKLE